MKTVEENIIDIVKKITEKDEISLDTKLGRESGIDSLGIVTLIIEIEEMFKINCDDFIIQIRNAQDVKSLCEIVCIMIEQKNRIKHDLGENI